MVQKKRRRKGRPRIEGREREPNGRIQRPRKPAEDPRAVVMAARARLFGLPLNMTPDAKTASWIGRMCLAGRLSEEGYFAFQRFLQVYNTYRKTILSPGAVYEPRGALAGANDNEDEYANYAARARARYVAAEDALGELARRRRDLPILDAVRQCVIHDAERPCFLAALTAAAEVLRAHFAAERRIK